MSAKRVLVTGAGGFVGRHSLPRLLQAGFEVHALSTRPRHDGDGVTWHVADLLVPGAPTRLVAAIAPTHLLNLAWCTEPGRYLTSLDNGRWLAAGVELQLAFAQAGGARAVHAGSCAEYDWHAGPCVEERTPLRPTTLYGRCKQALFQAAQGIAAESGSSLAWGRLFFLYGPGERPERLVPALIRGLLGGTPVPCTSGEQRRDFLYIEDAAQAFVALLASNLEGAVNIASGTAESVRDVIDKIVARLGRRELVQLGARPAPDGEPAELVADVTRLHTLPRPAPLSLDEGLERTIAWWRENR